MLLLCILSLLIAYVVASNIDLMIVISTPLIFSYTIDIFTNNVDVILKLCNIYFQHNNNCGYDISLEYYH
ncbi:hypothetical protein Catovirus_1_16 [Catovirus CTV1]|uniref:Uncharacterized protein n=1 Tax=Catovirus CTV1 TaxID=1977631 RepID=A0A1V0S8E3_9VIRU|nr:hypothetical protein Catovirus_1_16 [Catovirus CTV1]